MAAVRLLPVANTRALLAIDGPASATFNTIIEAADAYEGAAGNQITLTMTAGGSGTGTITVSGTAVTFTFESTVTTVANFEAALAAHTAASALMRVKTAGTTQGYALTGGGTDNFAATNLTGGGATTSATPTLTTSTLGACINSLGPADQAIILVRNVDTVSGTTKTATVTIWGWHEERARWYALGTLNNATAIAETGTDAINYGELLVGLRRFSRLYAQLSVGGAGTEIEIYADPIRSTSGSH